MTLVTLRPNGTTINSGVAVLPSGTAHGVLSDNSDSTQCSFFGLDELQVTLPDITLPAGAVIRTVAVRLRTATGGEMPWPLYVNLTGIEHDTIYTATSWSTPTTVAFTVWANEAFTAASINAAEMRFVWDSFGGTDRQTSLFEAYLDVTYVAKPVANVTAPTGTVTNANRPTITWTATLDPDGGPQVAHTVAIRDDDGNVVATNPASSAFPATTSWTPSTPLPDGDYTVEVAVAQSFNGELQWSAVDTQAFTIDVDRPAAPLLSAQAQPAEGRVALNVTADQDDPVTDWLEVERSADGGVTWEPIRTERADGLFAPAAATGAPGRNLLGSNTQLTTADGWTASTAAGFTLEAGNGISTSVPPGGWLHHATNTTAASRLAGYFQAAPSSRWAAAVPGEPLHVYIETIAELLTAGASLWLQMAWHNASDTLLSTSTTSIPLTELGAASHQWETPVAPAGATRGRLSVFIRAVAAGTVRVLTRLPRVDRVAISSYADGDTIGWGWDGTPRASASRGPFTAAESTLDHEAPIGRPLLYRARGLHDYAGSLVPGDWSALAAATLDAGWWLRHPTRPSLNVKLEPHAFPSVARAARQGLHHPLGSSAAVVVSDSRGPLTGTITVRVDTDEQRAALDELLDTLAPLQLVGPAGQHWADRWVSIADLQRDRFIDKAFVSETLEPLPFTVVPRPTDVLELGALWEDA